MQSIHTISAKGIALKFYASFCSLTRHLFEVEEAQPKWQLKGPILETSSMQPNQNDCIPFIWHFYSSLIIPDLCKGLPSKWKWNLYMYFYQETRWGFNKEKFTCFSNWPNVDFSFLCVMENKALGKTRIFTPLPKINIFLMVN